LIQLTKFLFLIFLFLGFAQAQTDSDSSASAGVFTKSLKKRTPTIAILPFEDANVSAREEGFGKVVASMLNTHLRNETNFIVLERSRLAGIVSEQSYLQSGLTQNLREQLSKLHSVEVILVGEISKIGNTIQIDTRLISIENGQVMVAEYAEVKGQEELRSAISKLSQVIELKYLRQWMGDLHISATPVEGEVYLDRQYVGKASQKEPLVLKNILEGEYLVSVLAGGYEQFEQKIKVNPRSRFDLQVSLQSLPGSLSISSDPKEARVILNGKDMGKTPMELTNVAEGKYTLELVAPNYQNWLQRINIQSGQNSEVKAKLTVIPGSMMVASEPSGAEVFFEKQRVGKTPLLLENIPPGSAAVYLQLEGYEPKHESVQIKPGEKQSLEYKLDRLRGKLTVVGSLSGLTAKILDVNEKELMQQELPFHKMDLDADSYWLVVEKDQFYPVKYSLKILPNQENRVEIEMKEKPAVLHFTRTSRTPADVFIDGVYAGKADGMKAEVLRGKHQIVLRDYYKDHILQVDLQPNEQKTISAEPEAAGPKMWLMVLGGLILSVVVLGGAK
jgi:TolB-like protein